MRPDTRFGLENSKAGGSQEERWGGDIRGVGLSQGHSGNCAGEGGIEATSTEEVRFCHEMYIPLHLEATEREMATCSGVQRPRFEPHGWLTVWPWAKHSVSPEFHFSSFFWMRGTLPVLPSSKSSDHRRYHPWALFAKGPDTTCGFQGNKRPEPFLLGGLSKKKAIAIFPPSSAVGAADQLRRGWTKKGSHTWSAKWSKWCHPSRWTLQFANYFLINQTVVPQGRGAGLEEPAWQCLSGDQTQGSQGSAPLRIQ